MSAEYAVYHSMVGLERVKLKRWREEGERCEDQIKKRIRPRREVVGAERRKKS